MRRLAILIVCGGVCWGAGVGSRVEYIGGTLDQYKQHCGGNILTSDAREFRFQTKGSAVNVPYDKINLIEYGQKADRRYMAAVLISPVMLLSKSRKHFLTVGYTDEKGNQQAMVFRVDKNDIRTVLTSLEARTGRKVQFQDDEARKAGKG
jgi:hypothetical protein